MASRCEVIIHLDTSALIEIASTTRPLLRAARAAVARGDILALSTITAYEWLRGPRTEFDLELQRELCPADRVVTFGPTEAALAATLYRQLKSTRGREADIAIAAARSSRLRRQLGSDVNSASTSRNKSTARTGLRMTRP